MRVPLEEPRNLSVAIRQKQLGGKPLQAVEAACLRKGMAAIACAVASEDVGMMKVMAKARLKNQACERAFVARLAHL